MFWYGISDDDLDHESLHHDCLVMVGVSDRHVLPGLGRAGGGLWFHFKQRASRSVGGAAKLPSTEEQMERASSGCANMFLLSVKWLQTGDSMTL